MTYRIQQSTTATPLLFLMVDSTDHVTGKTGLSPTVTIRKVGGSFAAPAGAVTEIANGWYQVAGNATDSDTLGPLALHATGTAADPTDIVYEVVIDDLTKAALRPTTAGRTLDVSAGGEAGIDWANIGGPTTAVDLSGTSIKDDFATAGAEPAAVPAHTASYAAKVDWLFAQAVNKTTQTATQQLLRNAADAATIGTKAVSDDGTTFTLGATS